MLTQEEQVSRIVALVDAARGREPDGGAAGAG
jgi:hypothetical protein